jgi:hypothetical protein
VGVDQYGNIVTSSDPANDKWTVTPLASITWQSIACPSASLCVAVGQNGQFASSTHPLGGASQWTVATVDSAQPSAYENNVLSVACASTTVCVALDANGNLLTSSSNPADLGGWTTRPLPGATQGNGVACAPNAFCLATDDNTIYSSSTPGVGSSWQSTGSSTRVTQISCPTSSFCAAVGGGSMFTTSTPQASSAWAQGSESAGSSVACPSANLCLTNVGPGYGQISYSTKPGSGLASDWHSVVADSDSNGVLGNIACSRGTSPTCILADSVGNLSSSVNGDETAWTTNPVDQYNGLHAVSCPNASLCLAAGDVGHILTSTTPSSGASTFTRTIVSGAGSISQLTCSPDGSFCAALDSNENLLTSTDPASGSWKVIANPDPNTTSGGYLGGISCPDAHLCFATDGQNILDSTDQGATWSDLTTIQQNGTQYSPGQISCPSTSFCVVAGFGYNNVDVLAYSTTPTNSSSWVTTPGLGDVSSLSCTASHACALTADSGTPFSGTSNVATWVSDDITAPTPTWSEATGFGAISCPSAGYCVTSSATGLLETTDPMGGNDAWSKAMADPGGGVTAISCSLEGVCAAVDGSGNVIVGSGTLAPSVTHVAATSITQTGATLTGQVAPNGSAVTGCHFQYGTSTSYSSSVPCSSTPGGGVGVDDVSATVSGLSPDTDYHFRLVATNGNGTTVGTDHTLTTFGPASSVPWVSPPADLNTVSGGQSGYLDQPVEAPNGDVTALMYQSTPNGSGGLNPPQLVARTHVAGAAGFDQTVTLDSSSGSDQHLGVDGHGNLTAVWLDGTDLKAATWAPGGQPTVKTAQSNVQSPISSFAVGPDGSAIVTWIVNPGAQCQGSNLMAAYRNASGNWSTAITLARLTQPTSSDCSSWYDATSAAISATGRVVVAFHRNDYTYGDYGYTSNVPGAVYVVTRDAGSWSQPTTLSTGDVGNGDEVQAALDGSDNATVAWADGTNNDQVVTSDAAPGGSWSAPQQVPLPSGTWGLAGFGADSNGDLFVAVRGNYSYASGDQRLLSAEKPTGQAWQAPTDLGSTGGILSRLVVDPSGAAGIAWNDPAGGVEVSTRAAGHGWLQPQVAVSTSSTLSLGAGIALAFAPAQGPELVLDMKSGTSYDGATWRDGRPQPPLGGPTITSPQYMQVGQAVTADASGFSNSPSSYDYTWLRCDANGANCATITTDSGVTKATDSYTLVTADINHTIEVSVVAHNSFGASAASVSKPTQQVFGGPVPQTGGTACPPGSPSTCTAVGDTWANVTGTVDTSQDPYATSEWYTYGATPAMTQTSAQPFPQNGQYPMYLGSLQPNTTYYYELDAEDDHTGLIVKGGVKTFKTLASGGTGGGGGGGTGGGGGGTGGGGGGTGGGPTPEPTVTTQPAAPITETNAVLNGAIALNGAPWRGCSFHLWPAAAPGRELGPFPCDQTSQTTNVTATLPFGTLSPNTTYAFQLLALDGSGNPVYGRPLSFTTPPIINTVVSPPRGGPSGSTTITGHCPVGPCDVAGGAAPAARGCNPPHSSGAPSVALCAPGLLGCDQFVWNGSGWQLEPLAILEDELNLAGVNINAIGDPAFWACFAPHAADVPSAVPGLDHDRWLGVGYAAARKPGVLFKFTFRGIKQGNFKLHVKLSKKLRRSLRKHHKHGLKVHIWVQMLLGNGVPVAQVYTIKLRG